MADIDELMDREEKSIKRLEAKKDGAMEPKIAYHKHRLAELAARRKVNEQFGLAPRDT
ncbi:Uncharacterised protein [uncultured archaeon]|nr:Uncharacterised protein [uncultured archaeon]